MADGPNTLADLFTRLRETLARLASRFHRLRGLLKTQGHLWGAAGAAPFRLGVVTLGLRLYMIEHLFSRRNGLFGCTLVGDVSEKPLCLVACRLDDLTLEMRQGARHPIAPGLVITYVCGLLQQDIVAYRLNGDEAKTAGKSFILRHCDAHIGFQGLM